MQIDWNNRLELLQRHQKEKIEPGTAEYFRLNLLISEIQNNAVNTGGYGHATTFAEKPQLRAEVLDRLDKLSSGILGLDENANSKPPDY